MKHNILNTVGDIFHATSLSGGTLSPES